MPVNANAVEDFSCMNFKVVNPEGLWSLSEGPQITKAVVTWSIIDPGDCITKVPTGLEKDAIKWTGASATKAYGWWDGTWTSSRDGQNYVLVFEFDIPNTWLIAVGNSPGTYEGNIGTSHGMPYSRNSFDKNLWMIESIERKISNSQKTTELIRAQSTAGELWAQVLSNRQKLTRDDCKPEKSDALYYYANVTTKVKILTGGIRPKISVEITDPNNCIFLIHTPQMGKYPSDVLINFPFWERQGEKFWSNLVSASPNLITVSSTEFGKFREPSPGYQKREFFFIDDFSLLINPINSKDLLSIIDNKIIVTSELDLTQVDKALFTSSSNAQIVFGVYSRYDEAGSSSSGGWRITWTSATRFSATYSRGGGTLPGLYNSYQVVSTTVPMLDLLDGGVAADKAAADKAAADKAAAGSAFDESYYQAIADAEIAKIEAELKAAADKAAADKAAADKAAAQKKTTITCVKGKLTKKVTAVKPKCPTGYKVKK